jgi:S-adenosyl-L-methionine hydrolase (adenosine-forming)
VSGGLPSGPNVIALLTDFGAGSVYVGAMKGVMATIAPNASVIDITHGVTPQAIDEASFLLGATYRNFPRGTTFVTVVDPGVGSARDIVLVEARDWRFLAPDNGVLTAVLTREEPRAARYVRERRLFLRDVSATFHGRDIFAPVAARLAAGEIYFADVGPAARPADLTRLPGAARSYVVHVDPFGNLVTNVEAAGGALPQSVRVGAHTVSRGARTYADAASGAPFVYVGSFGTIEIGVPMASAAQTLGAGRGSPVEVQFG